MQNFVKNIYFKTVFLLLDQQIVLTSVENSMSACLPSALVLTLVCPMLKLISMCLNTNSIMIQSISEPYLIQSIDMSEAHYEASLCMGHAQIFANLGTLREVPKSGKSAKTLINYGNCVNMCHHYCIYNSYTNTKYLCSKLQYS